MTKPMYKKIILMCLVCLFTATSSFAQPHPQKNEPKEKFSPEEFQKNLEEYIVRETGMTVLEASQFFPLFHELHDKQREMNQKIMKLKRKGQKDKYTDMDYAERVEKICELKVESAEMEKDYYKKMCRKVNPQKVFEAMHAEDRFYRNAFARKVVRLKPKCPWQSK